MSYLVARRVRTWMERKIHDVDSSAVLEPSRFDWVARVEKRSPEIRREAAALLPSLGSVPNFDEVLPQQRALTQGESWKSFFLVALGKPVREHQALCPATSQALTEIPGLINAFFSILAPGTKIPPHRGPYAGVLRYHLGLIIPEGDVAIRVNGQVCRWAEGGSLVFDDSFEHEAWNLTGATRVILFVDLVRPLPAPLSLLNRALLGAFERSTEARQGYKKVMRTRLGV